MKGFRYLPEVAGEFHSLSVVSRNNTVKGFEILCFLYLCIVPCFPQGRGKISYVKLKIFLFLLVLKSFALNCMPEPCPLRQD